MAAIRQTIAVVDRSGKVVSTSKHLFGVFREARDAYRERKAEIFAEKQAKLAEKEARQAMAAFTFEDSRSAASSRNQGKSRRSHHRHPRQRAIQDEQNRFREDFEYSHPSSRASTELPRRHTAHDVLVKAPAPAMGRSNSVGHIDMDLVYGEAHPSALQQKDRGNEQQLNVLVSKAEGLLVEADCVHRSATATMAHLQKNPEAMAAVALTLAEISTLVSKMAPGIIASLKASAPTIFALLASPQFLIAAGVGIGVTVVMFGGYKIIKKITAANADNQPSVDEMVELQGEHSTRLEAWRKGVADAEAGSVGTSVDGEFITPVAAAMSGIDLTAPRPSRGVRSQYLDTESRTSSHHSRRMSSKPNDKEKEKKTKEKKKKRSSKLRLMFTT
jgi:hypothetical protein